MNNIEATRMFADIPIYDFDEVDSTQNVAKNIISSHQQQTITSIPAFIVKAKSQRQGRGRMNREWITKPGSSFISSIVYKFHDSKAREPMVSVSVACVQALKNQSIDAALKWPNDIVLEAAGRFMKIGGILSEVHGEVHNEYVIVGLGLNLKRNVIDKSIESFATSVESANSNFDVEQFEKDFIAYIRNTSYSIDDYISHLSTLGLNVKIKTMNGHVDGLAIGVNSNQELIVETDIKQRVIVSEGDVIQFMITK